MSRAPSIVALVVAVAALVAGAGCASDVRVSQTQLDAIQTRELDVPAERAFRAVVSALLEQHHEIVRSDAEGGILVTNTLSGSPWTGQTVVTVQVAVMPTSPTSSSVRLATSRGGQTRIDEEYTRLLQQRIEVHAHTPPWALVWEQNP